jgi:hypothetical protein
LTRGSPAARNISTENHDRGHVRDKAAVSAERSERHADDPVLDTGPELLEQRLTDGSASVTAAQVNAQNPNAGRSLLAELLLGFGS